MFLLLISGVLGAEEGDGRARKEAWVWQISGLRETKRSLTVASLMGNPVPCVDLRSTAK